MFDGRLKPNPEDPLHDCLLLGDGDINNRGEGDEGFNTPVCRPRGVLTRRRCEGHRQISIELALKLVFILWPVQLRVRLPVFQAGQMGSTPIRAALWRG